MIAICLGCEKEFEAKRKTAITCSNACAKRVRYRRKHSLPLSGVLGQIPHPKKPKEERTCNYCNRSYIPFRKTSKFCSNLCGAKFAYYNRSRGSTVQRVRKCRRCTKEFFYDGSERLYHCSDECARLAAIETRTANTRNAAQWRANHPEAHEKYRETHKESSPGQYRSGLTQRFFKRYSHILPICQACGEKRIVELAHKKPRNGAWRTLKNTTDKDVWILCPTCHRCLDFGIETKESLGLLD